MIPFVGVMVGSIVICAASVALAELLRPKPVFSELPFDVKTSVERVKTGLFTSRLIRVAVEPDWREDHPPVPLSERIQEVTRKNRRELSELEIDTARNEIECGEVRFNNRRRSWFNWIGEDKPWG